MKYFLVFLLALTLAGCYTKNINNNQDIVLYKTIERN